MKIVKRKEDLKDWEKVNIEYREPLVSDSIKAEQVSGKSFGTNYVLALISEICLFDGKKKLYEDLINEMPTFFFNKLYGKITGISDEDIAKILL